MELYLRCEISRFENALANSRSHKQEEQRAKLEEAINLGTERSDRFHQRMAMALKNWFLSYELRKLARV